MSNTCYVCGTTDCFRDTPSKDYVPVCCPCDEKVFYIMDIPYGIVEKTWAMKHGGNAYPIIAFKYKVILDGLRVQLQTTSIQQEKPCKQCGRPNDVGVAKCWCCETQKPTT